MVTVDDGTAVSATGDSSAVVYDLPDPAYRAWDALSQSGAKALLRSPAKFHWEQTHERPDKPAFDFGHAAHQMALGVGPDIERLEFKDRRTKAYGEAEAAARAAGRVPLLAADHDVVKAMADVLLTHPTAGPLFTGEGEAEVSLIWYDEQHGINRKARFDWFRITSSGRIIVVDYKSTVDASKRGFGKQMHDFGYAIQAPWYSDAATACELDDHPGFVFVAQEKTPPFLVAVYEPDEPTMAWGRDRSAEAMLTYRTCMESGEWPGYGDEVQSISLPPWAFK